MPVFAVVLPWLVSVWSFIKAHWRPFALAAALLVAFVGGRCSVPRPTVTKTTVTDKHTVVQKHVDATEQKTSQKDVRKDVVVFDDKITHPDGTVEDKSETYETVGTEQKASDVTHVTADQHTDVTQHTVQTVTITPASKGPKWLVYADLGVPVALKKPYFGVPYVVVGIEHQIWGPLFAGPWVSIDVKGQNPAVGISVGVSF